MKILVIGVGGIGGFFGAHLHSVGEDVTFLVRELKKPIIQKNGIKIKSSSGNLSINPRIITKDDLKPIYDIILLTCKSYDLMQVINDLSLIKFKGIIIPFLNGKNHLEVLDEYFDKNRVYGGVAYISSNVDNSGIINHIGINKKISFGSRFGENSDIILDFYKRCKKTKFDSFLSENIDQEIWEKWIFIATVAGATTLFKTSLDKINSSEEGKKFILDLFDECCKISSVNSFPIRESVRKNHETFFINPNSKVKASMLIDMEKKSKTEFNHIFEKFIKFGESKNFNPILLKSIFLNMLIYEKSLKI